MSDHTLLITVDSIRADHQKYLERTNDFLSFEQKPVFATAPATYSSFQSIIGGQYASKDSPVSVFAEEFDKRTIGITTNNFLSTTYGFDDGFDYFTSPKSDIKSGWKSKLGMMLDPGSRKHKLAVRTWSEIQMIRSKIPAISVSRDFRNADSVIDEFIEEQRDHSRWFAWLHFMEPHHPYNPPNSDLSRAKAKSISRKVRSSSETTDSDEQKARSLYKDEVKWIDRKLDRLWNVVPDDTRVLFCSDHGEYLGKDGYWGHGGELKPTVLRVPMGYKGIENTPNGELVSLIDVPTILLGGSEYLRGKMDRTYAYAKSNGEKAVFGTDGYVNTNGTFNYKNSKISDNELEDRYDQLDRSNSSRMDAGVEEDLRALGYLE